MKYFRPLLLYLLFAIIHPLFSFGQVRFLDWKKVITSPPKTINPTKEQSLKLIEPEDDHRAAIDFSFEKPLYGVNFSIPIYGTICQGECDNIQQLIRVLATNAEGEKVSPDFTFSDGQHLPVRKVDENTLQISGASRTEINVSFAEDVQKLKVLTELATPQEHVIPFLEISEIQYVDEQGLIPNPSITSDCTPKHIIFAIDRSGSIETREYRAIKNAIHELLQNWDQQFIPPLQITIFEFDRNAELIVHKNKLNTKALLETNPLGSYLLQDQTSQNPSITHWTNWEAALILSEQLIEPKLENILFFITDGMPNGNTQDTQLANKSLKQIIDLANQIKEKNTHIYGIGSGSLSDSPAWMAYLTNGAASKIVQRNNLREADFILVKDFSEAFKSFSNLPISCPEKSALGIELMAHPNPASSTVEINITGVDLEHHNLSLSIVNSYGQTLKAFVLEDRENISLDISGIPSGIYQLVLQDNHRQLTQYSISIIQH